MKLYTRKIRASEALKKWNHQYPIGEGFDVRRGELEKLGPNPDPDDVDRITGNTSWTDIPRCLECGADGVTTAMVGEKIDNDLYTYLCFECLSSALKLFEDIQDER